MKSKKYKIGICGYFDTCHTIVNGQTLRTLSVSEQLERSVGKNKISRLDYSSWKKKPISVLLDFITQIVECKAIIICPDERAIKFMVPVVWALTPIFQTKKYYIVIGGWLPAFLNRKKYIRKILRTFDGIFVQTNILIKQLRELEIRNVYLLPNFRVRNKENQCMSDFVECSSSYIPKLCFLSRIEEKKGIIEMVEVIKKINKKNVRCTLDIYGPIQNGYEKEFENICSIFSDEIQYKGVMSEDELFNLLPKYDLQLFPTKYATEGFPGSILASFYTGVPVLAAEWNSGREVIEDNIDGVLFRLGDYEDMYIKLERILKDKSSLNNLKKGCRKKADLYDAESVIKELLNHITC